MYKCQPAQLKRSKISATYNIFIEQSHYSLKSNSGSHKLNRIERIQPAGSTSLASLFNTILSGFCTEPSSVEHNSNYTWEITNNYKANECSLHCNATVKRKFEDVYLETDSELEEKIRWFNFSYYLLLLITRNSILATFLTGKQECEIISISTLIFSNGNQRFVSV